MVTGHRWPQAGLEDDGGLELQTVAPGSATPVHCDACEEMRDATGGKERAKSIKIC